MKLNLSVTEKQKLFIDATESEVLAMIDGGEFIPYFKSFISTLFDIRHRYSSMTRGAEGNERA